MKIIKWGLTVLVVLLVLVYGIALTLPTSAHVERSAVIEAPPPTVFGLVNNLRAFNDWSPWARIDPHTEYEFSGPPGGVGAKMAWTSDDPSVGSGSQEITASEPDRLVRTRLDFADQGTAEAYFELEPEGAGTRITWAFDASFDGSLLERYVGLIVAPSVGNSYEEGLHNLKALAEGTP